MFGQFREPSFEFFPWYRAAPLSLPNQDPNDNIYVNAMPHFIFIWNDEIVEYIAQHGVTPDRSAFERTRPH